MGKGKRVNKIKSRDLYKVYVELKDELFQATNSLKYIYRNAQLLNKYWNGGRLTNRMYRKLNSFYVSQVRYVHELGKLVLRIKYFYNKLNDTGKF